MSFSSDVKSELFNFYENNRHCRIAELSAILNACGTFFAKKNRASVRLQTENKYAAVKCMKLIKLIFGFDCEVSVRTTGINKNSRVYCIYSMKMGDAVKILHATGIIIEGKTSAERKINSLVVSGVCCKRAFIRGAFLASGSLCNPEKTYHLELVNSDLSYSEELKELINSFGIDSKIVKRKRHFVVYIKEGEQIVDLLNIMSAHRSLMDLENVRIVKGLRNNVNRIVNCETANLNKTVLASVRQRESIEYIKNTVGLGYLPRQLEETAVLRLSYPDLSLKELGEMFAPPVGKSGVNHRLKKICSIAENLREDTTW